MHARGSITWLPGSRSARIDALVDRLWPRAIHRRPSRIRCRWAFASGFARRRDDSRPGDADPRRADVRGRPRGARRISGNCSSSMSRQKQVTIFISTHFMNEAMRCDRISLMHAGTVLACDTPSALVAARGAASLEEAFIAYIADATGEAKTDGATPAAREEAVALAPTGTPSAHREGGSLLNLGRLLAYSRREAVEIRRDPVTACLRVHRLAGPHAGLRFRDHHGRSRTSVFASMDFDQTPESRAYLAEFRRLPLLYCGDRRSTARKKPNGGCRPTRSHWRSRFRTSSAATSNATSSPEMSAVVDGR